MLLEYAVFAVTVIIFLTVAILYLMPGGKRVTTVPGPEPLDDLEGNFPDIASSGSLHEFLLDMHETYGPIMSFWWGRQLAVSIASPQLFKDHSKPFDRPAEFFELFRPLIDQSIQYANGSDGRMRHKAYAACYTTSAVNHYYEILQQLTEEMVNKWCLLPSGEHIALKQYMMAFSIKANLQASLGAYFKDDTQVLQIRRAYDYCWNEMEDRLRGDMPELSGVRVERFEKNKELMYSIVKSALKHRRAHPPGAGEHLAIDAIIDLDMSEEARLSDMISLLVGGFHTSGLMLTWATYFLASHPDVQEKAYKEVKKVIGEEGQVDPDNFKELIYLHQVLDETLRCSVLAPYAGRVQDFDIELGGHKIQAGTPVIQALGVVLQDPTLYPEPDKFDPERFNSDSIKKRPAFSFEPFGFAGKRKCPGYRFSLIEACILFVELLKKFKITLVEGQVVTPIYGLVTTPKEEIWITLEKRK